MTFLSILGPQKYTPPLSLLDPGRQVVNMDTGSQEYPSLSL